MDTLELVDVQVYKVELLIRQNFDNGYYCYDELLGEGAKCHRNDIKRRIVEKKENIIYPKKPSHFRGW